MKTLLTLALLLLAVTAPAQIVYKGGLISTKGPLPVGGDFVLDLNPATGYFVATTSVDCQVIEGFIGVVDSRGRFTGSSTINGYPIRGQLRVRHGYATLTGFINAGAFRYKLHASAGVFPD